jgi:transcriptional regulator with XRE-family HTH domain
MTPREIKNSIEDHGLTQRALARQIGVSEMSVSDVINKKRISDRIMRAISEAIKQDHRYVFSEYYFHPPKRATSKSSCL